MKKLNGTSIAWLSSTSGAPILIENTVSIGRSPNCTLVLNDPKVSRRHAVVHPAGESEFWVSDLGGCNGIYVNDHRIHRTRKLQHGDRIRIADFAFQFLCPDAVGLHPDADAPSEHTLPECSVENRWLLVADIMDGTQWASKLDAEEYPRRLDRWFRQCRIAVEENHGSINNYVGDGFLADWVDRPETVAGVHRAMLALAGIRSRGEIPFRFVLHHGEVTASGVGTMGEESLLGPEVNYIFRMEKVAARNGFTILVSETAAALLSSEVELEETPAMNVPSFGSNHAFYTFGVGADSLPTSGRVSGRPVQPESEARRKRMSGCPSCEMPGPESAV